MAHSEYVSSVAESLIKQLEMGIAPWQKPWQAGERFMPHNASRQSLSGDECGLAHEYR